MNKESKKIDLHVHTNYSDGTFSPKEVVEHAVEVGLCAVAITDHDCVDAVPVAMEAAKAKGLEIIPGVELSAEVDDFEVHIVGLIIDWQQDWFNQELQRIREARINRMQKMVKKLNAYGIGIMLEEVLALSKHNGSVGRLHLARALYEKGYTRGVREAFDRFIGRDGPCYEKRLIISPQKTIEMIRKVRGVPIFAHPGNIRHDEVIPALANCGLMGIEVFHIDHSSLKAQHYKRIAKKHDLLLSGGSDCHGAGKGFPLMGMVSVPYELLDKIKEARIKEFGK